MFSEPFDAGIDKLVHANEEVFVPQLIKMVQILQKEIDELTKAH